MKKYPFKFLDSYSKEDSSIFFGRDQEIDALYEMVFQSSIILVHGTSGTGKTSLIQCGLASKFEQHDWLPINIRRGKNINQALEKALEDECPTHKEQLGLEWLKEFEDPVLQAVNFKSALITKLQLVYRRSYKRVYLIFDQFEELYIFGSNDEQIQLIRTVKEILSEELPITMIFSIREEYLGSLYDFEKAVPLLSRKKLRVETMNLARVKEVIHGVTNQKKMATTVSLKSGEEGEIPEKIYKIIKGDEKVPGIQLPYLQVFMDKLYLTITKDETRKAEAEISMTELEKMNNIGDVLRNFLEDQVIYAVRQLNTKYYTLTLDLVWKILSPFVTLEGTKEPITKATLFSRLSDVKPVLISDLVELFVNRRVLRYSESSDLYEVSHDALAQKIASKRTDDEIAILEIQQLIRNQLTFKGGVNLLNEKQVNFITPYMKKLKLSPTEEDLIEKSITEIESEKKRKQERLRNTFIGISIAFVLLVILLIYIWDQRQVNNETIIELQKLEQRKDSMELQLKYLQLDSRNLISYNDTLVSRYKKDSSTLVTSLLLLQDSITKQITITTNRLKKYQHEVFLERMQTVINRIMSENYNYYSMNEFNELIDSNANKSQQTVYIGMIRDSIIKAKSLPFKVRLLFYLNNGTGDTTILAEIQNLILNNIDQVDYSTLIELYHQTEYRSNRKDIYGRLRFKIFEALLDAKKMGQSKMSNYNYLMLLLSENAPLTPSYDLTEITIEKDLLAVPFYVPYFKNIDNYFEAINVAMELTDGKNINYPEEKAYGLRYLLKLNKFIFCVKVPEFLGNSLSKNDGVSILSMLPDNNSTIESEWKDYSKYKVPRTIDSKEWVDWLTEYPEIAALHSTANLEMFKSKVRQFWQANKKSLPEVGTK